VLVVDAGVVLALLLPLPFSDRAAAEVRSLCEAREELYAPALLEYEVCSAVRQAVARKIFDGDRAAQALDWIQALRIHPITPASSLHVRALSWAERLGHNKTYDAHYLALAEEMRCPLLTADLRLVRAARALGADWVMGLEQPPQPAGPLA
jgi:predicted nucleic acid-binding protein